MIDKVYTCIGARNFAKTDRQKEDFYALEKCYKSEPKVRWLNYD